MPKVIAIKPEVGDLVYFYHHEKSLIAGPYQFMGNNQFMDIHTKEVSRPIGMVCSIEPETVVYGADMEMVKELQKKIIEEIKNS